MSTISVVILLNDQAGFGRGRSTIDNVFILNQIIENRREFNLPTHLEFIDYKKAFYWVKHTNTMGYYETKRLPTTHDTFYEKPILIGSDKGPIKN